MSRLTEIPVLGKLIRIGSAFIKAPKRFDCLFAQVDSLTRALDDANSSNQALRTYAEALNQRIQGQEEMLLLYRSHLRMHSRLLDHCSDGEEALLARIEAISARMATSEGRQNNADRRLGEHDGHIQNLLQIKVKHDLHIQDLLKAKADYDLHIQDLLEAKADTERRLGEHDGHILKMLHVESDYLKTIVDRICMEYDRLTDLNRELSIHPTIWGDPNRIHVDETAAVLSCLFNTNSGSITVGKYTFAGSNVSLLAGTHEMHLQGYLRRSAEITKGCDIVVGDGVWLASGCTLLGPCTVGDNAVIAAGAVVTPGTHVPANAVYGGVPARQIAELDLVSALDGDDPYLQNVFNQSNGAVMISGWTEKKDYPGIGFAGYWLKDEAGILLTNREHWVMHYALEGANDARVVIAGENGMKSYRIDGGTGVLPIEMPIVSEKPEMLSIHLDGSMGRLFMALVNNTDEK